VSADLPPNRPATPALANDTTAATYFWLVRILPLAIATLLLALVHGSDMPAMMSAFQQYTRTLPDAVWASLTMLGHGSVLLALVVLAWKYRPDWILACVCGGIVTGAFSNILKNLIGGPRPAAVMPADQLHVIGSQLLNHSFPSGHTATAFLFAGIVLMSRRPPPLAAVAVLSLAILTGLSRIAVGAHWPIDTIAGAAGGWFSAAVGIAFANRLRWLDTAHARLAIALLILGSSISLFFISTGYPLALPVQYFCACLGVIVAGQWGLKEWSRLR